MAKEADDAVLQQEIDEKAAIEELTITLDEWDAFADNESKSNDTDGDDGKSNDVPHIIAPPAAWSIQQSLTQQVCFVIHPFFHAYKTCSDWTHSKKLGI